jgi:hypothetical protein
MPYLPCPRRPTLALALQAAILNTAFGAVAAHAEPSPALDRVSVSVGGFIAKPRIHADGDTSYGYLKTPESCWATARASRSTTSATIRITTRT